MGREELLSLSGEVRGSLERLSVARDPAVRRIEAIIRSRSRAGKCVTFPHGWCDFASCVLAGHIAREGGCGAITLVNGCGDGGDRHWWLHCQDFEVDVTCDQFEDAPPVPFVGGTGGWHDAYFSEQHKGPFLARKAQALYFERAVVTLACAIGADEEVKSACYRRALDGLGPALE